MAAEKRHDGAAVLGHGNDRRLGPFIAEMRRQYADESARRADADDRRTPGEQQARMGGERLESHIASVDPPSKDVDRGAVEPIADAPGGGKPAGTKDHNHRPRRRRVPHRQASPR